MATIFCYLLGIFDLEELVRYGGLFLVCALVFCSVGLFFCFFIPIGAVLFGTGIYVATGTLHANITVVCTMLVSATIVGNITGYWLGRKAGPALYRRKDTRFFRQKYLQKTEAFYREHGKLALIVGFFLPIIRTFSPMVAGIVRMDFRRFILSTVAGAIVWVGSFVLAGYFIAKQPLLKPWLKYFVGVFILLVTVPLIIKIIRELKRSEKANASDNLGN